MEYAEKCRQENVYPVFIMKQGIDRCQQGNILLGLLVRDGSLLQKEIGDQSSHKGQD